MSFFISTKKDKIKDIEYAKQAISSSRTISSSRIKEIQIGAGKIDNITIVISKKFSKKLLDDDLYLQGPKYVILHYAFESMGITKDGIAKDVGGQAMDEKAIAACKKAKKHLKKFIEKSKPSAEDIRKATIDAFILYACNSKYIKISNKDISKLNKK